VQPVTVADNATPTTRRLSRHFKWSQPREVVLYIDHAYWAFPLLRGIPVFIGTIGLIALLIGQIASDANAPLWNTLEILDALLTLVLLAHWLIFIIIPWWFQYYIVTDLRVIRTEGPLTRSTSEIPITNIQEVKINQPTFIQIFFHYGSIIVTAGGGKELRFDAVNQAEEVSHAIARAQEMRRPPMPKPPTITDAVLEEALESLGAQLTNPNFPAMPPKLSVKWPLSGALQFAMNEGESPIGVIYRHWSVLFLLSARSTLLVISSIFLTTFVTKIGISSLWPVTITAGIIGLIWFGVVYLNFVDDAYLVTSRRIIDVERHYFVLQRTVQAIEYKNIQKVDEEVPTIWSRIFGTGTISINVSGQSAPLVLRNVPHPDVIVDLINRNREIARKRVEIREVNSRNLQMKDWFATVLNELIIGAPDLRGMPLEDALSHVQEQGLNPIIASESYLVPGVPAGIVISQIPMPGSRVLRGGDVSLILSRLW
jgi:uncharacterized membrane protein YdbT with pleckstrin-like domain